MKRNLLQFFFLPVFLIVSFAAKSQSTNGSTSSDRENWLPNKGNVGIGTRRPSEALEVIGNVKVSETLYTKNLETVGLKANTLTVAQDATIGRNLLVSGNVGIGISGVPGERLEIAGNIKVSNSIFTDKIVGGEGSFSRSVSVDQNLFVSGNTGLGVASPTEKLEVSGSGKFSQALLSNSLSTGEGLFTGTVKSNQNVIALGSIGVGTTSPTEKLEVAGNVKGVQGIFSSSLTATDGLFSGDIKGSSNLIINGNTGLGIAAPSEKLDVAGNIKASGKLSAASAAIGNEVTIGKTLAVSGNVGLGVTPGTDRLSVAGNSYFDGVLTAENLTVKQSLDLKGNFSVAGALGVGIASPEATLHVNGDGKFDGNISANKITVNSIEIAGAGQSQNGGSLSLGDNLFVNGSVGIGTTKTTGYKLSVNGKIRASDDIKVYLESAWSDFVFEKTYRLKSLQEVEAYIAKNGRLPDLPSAKEVKENGFDLGAMDAKLLQKIEELTLYMIEVKKENELLKKELSSIKSTIKKQ